MKNPRLADSLMPILATVEFAVAGRFTGPAAWFLTSYATASMISYFTMRHRLKSFTAYHCLISIAVGVNIALLVTSGVYIVPKLL
ncbi:hypothetical protein SAMN05421819_3035 [Bryocella elongata]|uniref:Uncharacterized protein n=1 Tax=Bryocella elongata TaxID=863522 RepID=A0A1H6AC44_9BACT|nr:hypothetical protein [Bryocella elongata]SEG45754.1 hypothetical protein SAMN05421819_3035 [Bryocella elongata]